MGSFNDALESSRAAVEGKGKQQRWQVLSGAPILARAFDGPVFSSADPGNGGFPSANDNPADVSCHRAGIFQKQPLVWP